MEALLALAFVALGIKGLAEFSRNLARTGCGRLAIGVGIVVLLFAIAR